MFFHKEEPPMEWKPVRGFPGYSVNPLGQVRRDSSGRCLHPKVNQYGVPYVGLMRDWEQKHRSLALLVANAFLPRALEAFDTPINLDGDRFNCAVDNLMWRPRWFAVQYNRQFRERYPHPIEYPIRDTKANEVLPDSLEVAKRYGLLEKDVVLSILNRTYTWPTYQIFEVVE
jgi:hypothetical protein